MYCNKCGKEIKEDNKFCTYCGKAVKESTEQQDNSIEIESHNVEKKKTKIIIYILIITIIICLITVFNNKDNIDNIKGTDTAKSNIDSMTKSISQPNSIMGNTQGNIINCGYSVKKDDYIYFVSPNEDMNATQISRVKSGTNQSEIIYKGDYDIHSLNIIEDKIYFISIFEDGINNKICKMDLDGSDLMVINNDDCSCNYYDMYTVNNKIYYVGKDNNIYTMNLQGENRQLLIETGTGFLTMNDKYIIYNKNVETSENYITYINTLNGTEEREIISEKISNPIIYNDYIYYINSEQYLEKMSITDNKKEEVTDYKIYCMNILNGFIYYLNYKDEVNEDYTVALYKLSLDDGQSEIVKELLNYSSFLNVIDDYAYYMDMDEEKAFINLVNVNDFSEIKLNEWFYNNESNKKMESTETNSTANQTSTKEEKYKKAATILLNKYSDKTDWKFVQKDTDLYGHDRIVYNRNNGNEKVSFVFMYSSFDEEYVVTYTFIGGNDISGQVTMTKELDNIIDDEEDDDVPYTTGEEEVQKILDEIYAKYPNAESIIGIDSWSSWLWILDEEGKKVYFDDLEGFEEVLKRCNVDIDNVQPANY